ncbi:MAG: flagellar hook-length control protein FliK [bacterium]|nr:flagellar hook-length control protein FliK [bacterium]
MTQVAKLNTNVPATDKGTSIGKSNNAKSLAEQFAGIMNQSTRNLFGSNPDFQKASQTNGAVSGATKKEPYMAEYSKPGYGNRAIAEEKPKTISVDDYSDKLDAVADEVKDALEETLGVSEEEIQEAMSTLGLVAMDLLEPQNLILLAAQVSGSDDMTDLLVNDSFQDMMQTITGIISDFLQNENIEPNQFSDLLAEVSAMNQAAELPGEVTAESVVSDEQALSNEAEAADVQIMQTAETQMLEQPDNKQAETVVHDAGNRIAQPAAVVEEEQLQRTESAEEAVVSTDGIASDVDAAQTTKNNTQNNDFSGGQSDSKQFHDELSDANEQTPVFQPQTQDVIRESAVPRMEAMQPEMPMTMSYYEVEQLMQQVDGLARIFAADQSTTIEMQLNPENLGKLYLSVSEKQGAVTAQITASNEQVKETLQAQMVELRQTLQAQGIKVEAVEVTVATHEFEQNLDGNSSADAQFGNGEKQENQNHSTRRNLNLSEVDDIPVDLSEAEALAAQMMRDNGNQVDFSA